MKKSKVFISIILLFIIFNMIFSPQIYIEATFNGLLAWATSVLPSILPFIFFTKVLTHFEVHKKFSSIFASPCKKLFGSPPSSSFVFLTSIFSGYPIGASMIAQFYGQGQISQSEAFRMCSFCSTSGPMFIIGAVGVSMFGDAKVGYILLVSHIFSALINGLFYRKIKAEQLPRISQPNLEKETTLSSLIQDTILSVLSVGGVIAIFFVIITALSPIFSVFPPQIASFLEGLIEITKGCSSISQNLTGISAIMCASFVVSFGGLSCIIQSYAFLDKIKMPISLFLLQKFTHALLSCLISLPLCLIIL